MKKMTLKARRQTLAALAGLTCLAVGCYDSRWGQAEKSARNNATDWVM